MFLFKWIKESFGIWFIWTWLIYFLLYTLVDPSGIIGWIILGALIFVAGTISCLWMFVFVPLYTIVYRPAITIAVKVPLILIKILIFLLIQLPLHAIGHSSSVIWEVLHTAQKNIMKEGGEDSRKRPKYSYIAVFAVFMILSVHSFGLNFETLTALVTDATLVSLPIILFPIIMTLLISSLVFRWKNGSFTDTDSIDETEEDQTNNTNANQGDSRLASAGRKAKGAYDKTPDAVKAGAAVGAYKGLKYQTGNGAKAMAKGGLESGGISIVRSLRTIPLVGSRLAGPLEGAIVSNGGVMGAGGAALGSLATALFWILIALIVLMAVWLLIAALLWLSFGAIFYFFIGPFMAETFGPAIGMGADYAAFGGSEVGGMAPNYDFTGERNALRMAGARVGCALEGPQCIRQWQMNNSERPGSESVGQEFGLEIENFEVNAGHTFDIAGRAKDDNLPIAFDIYNPVQGIRGIDAHEVQYRLEVDGSGHSCIADDNSDGESQWGRSLGTGQLDDGLGVEDGYIPAGGFARPVGTLEDLTLEDCGILQPALGIDKTATLQVKYDYSSQSTLSFQAMSEQYMQEEGMRPEPKQSQTADTPVRAYVNVQSPVVYREGADGRSASPVPVYVGFETDQFDIDYRVNIDELELYSSSLMTDVDTVNQRREEELGDEFEDSDEISGDCEDFNNTDGVYKVSDQGKNNIESVQEDTWFSRGFGPSPLRCDMVIEPEAQDTISPTGETLNKRIDANYTVRLSSSSESFDVQNTRCVQHNCPLVAPEYDANENIESTCDSGWRIDAADGCTVVDGEPDRWGEPEPINDGNSWNEEINNRETAYILQDLIDHIEEDKKEVGPEGTGKVDISYAEELEDNPEDISVGIEELPVHESSRVYEWNTGIALLKDYSSSAELEVETFDRPIFCEQTDTQKVYEYLDEEEFTSGNVIYSTYPQRSRGVLEEIANFFTSDDSCTAQN